MLLFGIGCGGPTKPARKKMPGFNSLGVSDPINPTGLTDFPFSTGEMDVQSGSTQSVFHSVALPDASYDSLAMGIIARNRPYAVSLLGQWSKQDGKGVVIDLRGNGGNTGHRADYILERAGEFSIPVIFLWDRSSEARAAAFIDIMRSEPSIQCRRMGNDPASF